MSALITEQQHIDLSSEELIEAALAKKEGVLSTNGALTVATGKRTGRSPKDRFIVRDAITDKTVDWGQINQPTTPECFQKLWQKAKDYLADKEVYISHLEVGADESYKLPVKVITQLAWHNLFARDLFIKPKNSKRDESKQWTILSAAGLTTDPKMDGVNSDGTVMINFAERKVLFCGMYYAGEMKKAMFSALNFLLPAQDVLPMHCAANMGENGDTALFFGLSGTGKTTLSADPNRYLIGDDEHGWSSKGIFNFEGGCYAKCINLSEENEPFIYRAIRRGAIMENVVLDEHGNPGYRDDSLTQNTRAAYPREHIEKRVPDNYGGHPKAVLFLTCDMFGVLPPIALLTKEQAAFYFLSGYTALVGSTEVGSTTNFTPTFSQCFGAPFFPRPAQVYADLLIKRIEETGAQVYLINTGWTKGPYGEGGVRFSIPTTRAIVDAVLGGTLVSQQREIIAGFHFAIPTHIQGIDNNILNPRHTWKDKNAYDVKARELMAKFIENFKQFNVSDNVRQAGPILELD